MERESSASIRSQWRHFLKIHTPAAVTAFHHDRRGIQATHEAPAQEGSRRLATGVGLVANPFSKRAVFEVQTV